MAPSLPGFAFSAYPEPADEAPWSIKRVARVWTEIMRRLGYLIERFKEYDGWPKNTDENPRDRSSESHMIAMSNPDTLIDDLRLLISKLL